MHFADVREPGMTRDRIEVEAESVAYVVCDLLGVDAGSYSIPYVANWAGADVELVEATAQKVLTTARQIVTGLEAELGVDLRPNPIAASSNEAAEREHVAEPPIGRSIGSGARRLTNSSLTTSTKAIWTGLDSPGRFQPSRRIELSPPTATPAPKRSCSPRPAHRPKPPPPS